MIWNVHRVDVTHYTEEEAGLAYLAVALTASSDDGNRYIEFQLADEEDRDWGYCIMDSSPHTVDASDLLSVARMVATHATIYGGLLEASLTVDELVLVFDDQAQQVFGWPRVLTLRLEVSEHDRDALRVGLRDVLAVGPDGRVPALAL